MMQILVICRLETFGMCLLPRKLKYRKRKFGEINCRRTGYLKMFGYSRCRNDYKGIPMKCSKQVLYLLISLFILGQFPLLAQAPFIESVSKTSAKAQETLTLQGINFGAVNTNIKVMF